MKYSLMVPTKDRIIGEVLRSGRAWEPEVALTLQMCSWDWPDATLLDAGAYIGTHTVPGAGWYKRVVAVEPLYAGLLRRNLELNGIENVEVVEAALGNQSGEAHMTPDEHNPGASHLSNDGNLVDMVTLADVMPEGDVILKMDIEGAENLVLTGADLSSVRMAVIEVCEGQLNRVSHATGNDLLGTLRLAGFDNFRFAHGETYVLDQPEDSYSNLVARRTAW